MKGKQEFSSDIPIVKAKRIDRKEKPYFRQFRPGRAGDVIGEVKPNQCIHGITDGHFSMVDIIEHLVYETKATRMLLSVWTASSIDIRRIKTLWDKSDLETIKMLVDRSFGTREPAYCDVLRATIGIENVRAWNCHAKFAVLRGGETDALLNCSMNLSQAKRIENFNIETTPELVESYEDMVEQMFRIQPEGTGLENARQGWHDANTLVRNIKQEGKPHPLEGKIPSFDKSTLGSKT